MKTLMNIATVMTIAVVSFSLESPGQGSYNLNRPMRANKQEGMMSYDESAVVGFTDAADRDDYRSCGVAGFGFGDSVTYAVGVHGNASGGKSQSIGGYFPIGSGAPQNVGIMGGWTSSMPEGRWAGAFGGNVWISSDLHLNGKLKMDNWTLETPDYVFADDYKLRSLDEVEKFIEKEKHLPEVQSAKEMKEEGVDIAELNMTLLKKVEELTLYLIDQKQTIENQNEKIAKLEEVVGNGAHKNRAEN